MRETRDRAPPVASDRMEVESGKPSCLPAAPGCASQGAQVGKQVNERQKDRRRQTDREAKEARAERLSLILFATMTPSLERRRERETCDQRSLMMRVCPTTAAAPAADREQESERR